MAELTANLGKAPITSIINGRYSHSIYFLDQATAAAPVTTVSIYNIQDISAGAFSKTYTDVIQFGGGDEKRRLPNMDGQYDGTIEMLSGGVPAFIAAMLQKTYTLAGEVAVPYSSLPQYPLAHVQSVLRKNDNETILQSRVFQDMIFGEIAENINNDIMKTSIPWRSMHDMFVLIGGAKMVLDIFTGDGSTTSFSLSATPLDLVTASLTYYPDWHMDNIVFVKIKETTDEEGTRQTSGVTESAGVLGFTTPPANGAKVSAFYAAAV